MLSTVAYLAAACAAGFVAGILDYGFAMGFGLVAGLVLAGVLGLDPRGVAGATALAQVITAIPAVKMHSSLGNVAVEKSRAKVLAALAAASLVGGVAAGSLQVEVSREVASIAYSAGLVILAITLLIASYRVVGNGGVVKALALGVVAGAYKAVIGGGYSVAMSLAQRLLGLDHRSAVALTPLTKLPLFTAIALIYGVARLLDPVLVTGLCVGAVASIPLAAKALRISSPRSSSIVVSVLLLVVASYRLALSLNSFQSLIPLPS